MKLGLSGAIPVLDEPAGARRDEIPQTPAAVSRFARPAIPWRRGRRGVVTVLMLIILVAVFWLSRRSVPAPPRREARLSIIAPEMTHAVSAAISPDGEKVVFVAVREGQPQLWLRPMDSVSMQPITATEGAAYPFWSPDSRSLGFFQDGKLKRLSLESGAAQTLARAPQGCGGAWTPAGEILFTPACDGPIVRVSSSGGEPTPLWPLEASREMGHRFPQLLSNDHVLFYAAETPEGGGIYVGSTDSGERRRLLDADASAVYAAAGYMLFVRGGTLFGLKVNADPFEIAGKPFPVADGVAVDTVHGLAAVSASAAGPVLYRTGVSREQRQFVWIEQNGRRELVSERDYIGGPRLSPDGRRVAFHKTVNGNRDIWVLDTARGTQNRLTFDPEGDDRPVWSPDGTRIAFQSRRKSWNDLYQKPAMGGGRDELLLASLEDKAPTDWSPDGRFILYQRRSRTDETGWDIWALPLNGDRKASPVVQTTSDEVDAQFSPDGNWIAYQSNESGRFEVYVQSFPSAETKAQISTQGGSQARWRRDGRQLFFAAPDGMLVAVPMQLSPGRSVQFGQAVRLFPTHVSGAHGEPQYVVSPNGRQFLVSMVTDEPASQIVVILNWQGER